MSNRKTIGLCCIAKNERANIDRLTQSIEGCFDKLYLTDTGSTDGTVERAKELGWEVSHFEWIDDFGAARNFNFSQAKTDYILWMDLDDVLTGREDFILWRDHAMKYADYWLATYDYATDKATGKPVVSFARERVINNNLEKSPAQASGMMTFDEASDLRKAGRKYQWMYFLHEGIPPLPDTKTQYATTWKITHQRTTEDLAKDKGRNLAIFQKKLKEIKEQGKEFDSRLLFYYGKELFEAGRPMEAYGPLIDAISAPKMEAHDRIMGIQYATFASMQCNQFDRAIALAHQGLQLEPQRAELWCAIGDCLVKGNRVADAIPFYHSAMNCQPMGRPGQVYAGAMFNFEHNYTVYPRNQFTRCLIATARFKEALEFAEYTQRNYPNAETEAILKEVRQIHSIAEGPRTAKECEDIVFTGHPNGVYEWDEEIYKTRGMGGSETACIEMAVWLKKLTGRPVKVFNNRTTKLVGESGVEWLPANEVTHYMKDHKPKMHIGWRHNIKCTDAKTYAWCHDLFMPTAEIQQNFDKIIALTPFHKNYLRALQGIPEEKIWVSRNGIVPSRFKDRETIVKNPMKICYPSSPDRGLDRAILCLDEVRKNFPVELHVFYGFDNLKKCGGPLLDRALRMEQMIKDRPWITFHGFTEQQALTRHFMESSVWLHPCDFIETFCITAIEMLCAGVYPVTRRLGALQNVLAKAEAENMATMLDHDCIQPEEFKAYIDATNKALETKAWEKVHVNPEEYSWEGVAKEWIQEMGL